MSMSHEIRYTADQPNEVIKQAIIWDKAGVEYIQYNDGEFTVLMAIGFK